MSDAVPVRRAALATLGLGDGLWGRGRSLFLLAELPDVFDDLVQAVAGDVLHRVVADAFMSAIIEDADDIGVVQPGGGTGLGAEPPQVVLAAAELGVHHLERHVAPERLAHGLVDHAHAALAEIAEDAVVSQPLGQVGRDWRDRRGEGNGGAVAGGFESLHQRQAPGTVRGCPRRGRGNARCTR